MRQRYGTAEQFLKLFTPDLQTATAQNEARAYLGFAPTLQALAAGYGTQVAVVWLCIQIENLNNFTGVREKMSVSRQKELAEKGQNVDFERLKEEIEKRDKQDSEREFSPLKRAKDAVVVDTSDMDIEEVVAKVKSLIQSKI